MSFSCILEWNRRPQAISGFVRKFLPNPYMLGFKKALFYEVMTASCKKLHILNLTAFFKKSCIFKEINFYLENISTVLCKDTLQSLPSMQCFVSLTRWIVSLPSTLTSVECAANDA